MTKIDIISGFLGAGKTTLIKKLINEAFQGEKLVLIENEFGEIGIDSGFLKDAGIEITEMNSGCICCSLVGDFGEALKKVLDQFTPDRIIIEPSGVGKLSDVILAVQDIVKENEQVMLNSSITIADVMKCKLYMKNFGEFYSNQIENAGTIILSRTQNATPDRLEACVHDIKGRNERAVIVTTPWDRLSGAQILEAMEKRDMLAKELLKEEAACPVCGHHHGGDGHQEHEHHDHGHEDHEHHGHHHADEVFTSWGVETPHQYSAEELESALKTLSESEEFGVILRAKGMLPDWNGEWIYFDLVPGEYELRAGSPEYTGRICVIGTNIDKAGIEKLFCI